LKPILFDLLNAGDAAGLILTESFAMLPTAAVSGFYFGHPQAEYFGVARIGEISATIMPHGAGLTWRPLRAGCGPIWIEFWRLALPAWIQSSQSEHTIAVFRKTMFGVTTARGRLCGRRAGA
jgi:hypothetical protein